MATHKSAEKRARQTERRRLRNSQTTSRVKTIEKKVLAAIAKNSPEEASSLLKTFTSAVGKAAQKGVVHAKRAARRVSRLSHQVAQLGKS